MKALKNFAQYIKTQRSKRFRSAREFCSQVDLGISYTQYARYESGEGLPPLELFLKICKILELEIGPSIRLWALAQIQDPELKTWIGHQSIVLDAADQKAKSPDLAQNKGVFEKSGGNVNDAWIMHRGLLKYFEADPWYRDLLTLIHSFAPNEADVLSFEQISKITGLNLERVKKYCTDLEGEGLLEYTDATQSSVRCSKSILYFPNDKDFFKVRNINFEHNIKAMLSGLKFEEIQNKKSYRGLVTRSLSESQIMKLCQKWDEVLAEVLNLPIEPNQTELVCVALSMAKRFSIKEK